MRTLMMTTLLGCGLLATACSKIDFAPVAEETSQATKQDPSLPTNPIPNSPTNPPVAPVCRTQNVEKARPVNILFIVDQSGSNVNGPYEHPGQATDPQKLLRSGIMADFVAQHGSQTNLRWSLITFNDTGARSLVRSSSNAPVFTSSVTTLNGALSTFQGSADYGSTPYKAALQLAASMIHDDRTAADPDSVYLIAFITDGYPTDYCPNSPTEVECPGRIQDSKLNDDVTALVNAAAGTVQLGTVYYGAADQGASDRLNRMATLGGGQFVDLNASSKIDLNDVITVPETVCE